MKTIAVLAINDRPTSIFGWLQPIVLIDGGVPYLLSNAGSRRLEAQELDCLAERESFEIKRIEYEFTEDDFIDDCLVRMSLVVFYMSKAGTLLLRSRPPQLSSDQRKLTPKSAQYQKGFEFYALTRTEMITLAGLIFLQVEANLRKKLAEFFLSKPTRHIDFDTVTGQALSDVSISPQDAVRALAYRSICILRGPNSQNFDRWIQIAVRPWNLLADANYWEKAAISLFRDISLESSIESFASRLINETLSVVRFEVSNAVKSELSRTVPSLLERLRSKAAFIEEGTIVASIASLTVGQKDNMTPKELGGLISLDDNNKKRSERPHAYPSNYAIGAKNG